MFCMCERIYCILQFSFQKSHAKSSPSVMIWQPVQELVNKEYQSVCLFVRIGPPPRAASPRKRVCLPAWTQKGGTTLACGVRGAPFRDERTDILI
jgi:hypothetical protein